jgi:PAS domain S-box-containing protein
MFASSVVTSSQLGNRLRIVCLLAALLLIGAAGVQSYRSLSNLLDLNARVEHTQEVLVQSGRVRANLSDAENNQRGYLVVPGEEFLDLYHSAIEAIPASVEHLRQLTADNSSQQARLVELAALIDMRLARMKYLLALRDTAPITDRFVMQVGTNITQRVDLVLSAINQEEERLYNTRLAGVQQGAHRTMALAGVLVAVSILMIIGLGAVMLREAKRRETSESALRQLNEQLDQRITARTKELSQANELMNAIVDSSPLAIVSLDRDKRIATWNRGAAELLGRAPQDVIGLDFAAVASSESGELLTAVDVLTAGRSEQRLVVSHHDGSDKPIRVQLFVAPLLKSGGSESGSLIVMEDLTERAAMEGQLRHAQKMDTVGQLTGGLAHDFNNLLAVIIGNLDYASEKVPAGSEERGYLERAQVAALRGAALTKQLLAFARRQPLHSQRVDINELVTEMITLQSRTLGESIQIKTDLASDLVPVMADSSQIESALLNLCVNARDAMPKGGTLTISTANRRLDEDYVSLYPDARVGDYVMLSVSDTGVGMSTPVAAKAFEPFFTTKDVGKGSGLGLSMVYGFAKQSGGHASIYSEAGVGTVVRLYLPQAEGAIALLAPKQRAIAPNVFTNQLILAVDDNPEVRHLVVNQLKGFGYRVIEAAHGPDALKLLRHSGPVDLLFTDVVMPGGVSGVDLARTARKAQPGLRVLFTSGFPDPTHNADIEEMGDLVISKPYLRAELADMVHKVLERRPGGSGS